MIVPVEMMNISENNLCSGQHGNNNLSEYDAERILEVVLAFYNEVDHVNLLNVILTKMMVLTCSDAGTLYIVENGKLVFKILHNKSLNHFKDNVDLPSITLDESNIDNVSAYVAIHNEIVVVDDVYSSERFNFTGPKNYDKLTGYHTRSMLVLPLVSHWEGEEEVMGVIQLLNATDPKTGAPINYGKTYNPNVIVALSQIAANTLSNQLHMWEIQQLFHSFVAIMTQAVDERSHKTKNHAQRVSTYCDVFAKYLSSIFDPGHPYFFTEKHRESLVIAAMLHDVGKITTPLNILEKSSRLMDKKYRLITHRFLIKKHQLEISYLKGSISEAEYNSQIKASDETLEFIEYVNKSENLSSDLYDKINELANITYRDVNGDEVPILDNEDMDALNIRTGTLTEKEIIIMRDHASITGRLLDQITLWKYYSGVSKWARDHHEFLDGTGYPQGLKGDELSIETCIITIADIYDALTSTDRPYRKSMTPEESILVLHNMADNGKLHKELVSLFAENKPWLSN